MIVLGIDPGLEGAFSLYDSTARKVVAAFSMPTLTIEKKGNKGGTARKINWTQVVDNLDELEATYPIGYSFCERVQAAPKQGVVSMFNFGRGFGGLEALIACRKWPVEFVTSAKWKRVLSVPADKGDAISRANQLLPGSSQWWKVVRGEMTKAFASGVAEATLIAFFGTTWLSERGLLDYLPRASGKRLVLPA